jgi:hypothetical protein
MSAREVGRAEASSAAARGQSASTFLIYAGRGAGGEELQPHYYEALKQPKTMWMIPEAGHTGGLSARPNEYERRVVGFFVRTLFPGAEDTS